MAPLTRSHAARRLGISRTHLRRLCDRGELQPSFVAGAHEFDEGQLEALAAKRAAKRAAPSRPSVTTAGAMRVLGVSRAHLRRLEDRGDVRPIRAGESGHRWYDVAELEQFAAERDAKKRPVVTTMTSKPADATSEPAQHVSSVLPQPGALTVSGQQLEELRSMLGSKISNANGLVARVRALAADYGALDEELRRTEDELADRVIELAETRAANGG